MNPTVQHVVTRTAKVVGESLADERVRRSAAGRLPLGLDDERELARSVIARQLDVLAGEHLANGVEPLDHHSENELIDAVLAKVLGLGRIQPLLDHPDVNDIHIRGCASAFLKLTNGQRVSAAPVVDSDEELVDLVRLVATRVESSARSGRLRLARSFSCYRNRQTRRDRR